MPQMKHPDFPDRKSVQTTKTAFARIWSAKGWEMVETSCKTPAKEPEKPYANTLTDSEVFETAKYLGIEDDDLSAEELRELVVEIPKFYDVENDGPLYPTPDPEDM